MTSTSSSHGFEVDDFDDAPESIEKLNVTIPKSSSTRSLTDSPPVGTITSPDTDHAPHPSESLAEQMDIQNEDSGQLEKAKKKNKKKKNARDSAMQEIDSNDQDSEEVKLGSDSEAEELGEPGDSERESDGEEECGSEASGKHVSQNSPLLTSRRLSNASSLDDVVLGKEDEFVDITAETKGEVIPQAPPKDGIGSPGSPAMGLSGNLPSTQWAPPPVKASPPQVPPPPTRKASGPFSWFSRSSTASNLKELKSPPQAAGRNTSNSVSTVASNADLVARSEDGDISFKKPRRNSLKDQFKMLRMREEATAEHDSRSVKSGIANFGHGPASPPIIVEEGEDGSLSAPIQPSGSTSPGGVSTISPTLAPGTVSGFSRSATDASAPVDWDLWQQLVNNGAQALANSEELNAAIKRGIPQTIRGVIWQILTDCQAGEMEEIYRELLGRGTDKDRRQSNAQAHGTNEKESIVSSRSSIRSDHSGVTQATSTAPSPPHDADPEKLSKEQAALESARLKKAKDEVVALQKLDKVIRRDLGARTSYSKYFISQGSQEGLFGLCKAYALYDEAVGYAQGMNFIVMPLLFNMEEVDAFELLVKLMNKYGLREMFIADMPGLHRSLYQFERLLEDLEPALYCHLKRRGVPPQLYATQWFLTLFAYRFPLQLVLRIYDLIFEEGLESTILKFSLALMRRNVSALLEMKDMSSLTNFLKERVFDAYIDKQPSASSILESGFFGSSGAADKEIYRADLLVQDACDIPLTKEMIVTYTTEWTEKSRIEKEQEAELEHLRYTVATQTTRLRLLEERSEASDKEHVQLASELIRSKVENEELCDENDALKLQVSELKNVVDKQPAEVEEKLRLEMERIMQRNLEVQNENRAMEESMADMEKELVATKMKWAEMSEEHDNLKQKWMDLRRAMD